MLLITMKNHF